jgi:hypothetical protein
MNSLFLVLIAIPLGVYLLVLLFSTRDLGADETRAEEATAHPPIAPESAVSGAEMPVLMETERSSSDGHRLAPDVAIVTSLQEPVSEFSEPAQTPQPRAGLQEPPEQSVEGLSAAQDSPPESRESASPLVSDEMPGNLAPSGASLDTAVVEEISARAPETATGEIVTTPESPPPAVAAAEPAPVTDSVEAPETLAPDDAEPVLPPGPLELPDKGSPKYAFDYRGRLWVEKKRKGFFRQLRRPQLPPEEPPTTSER